MKNDLEECTSQKFSNKMIVNRRISVVFVYMQMKLNRKCFLNHLLSINRSQLFSLEDVYSSNAACVIFEEKSLSLKSK